MGSHSLSQPVPNSMRPVPAGSHRPAPTTPHERAFVGLDLRRGRLQLVRPTFKQSADLANTTISAIYWAAQREQHRDEILRGDLPLVPPQTPKVPTAPRSNEELIAIFREVGLDRTLEIAAIVEAMITTETTTMIAAE